MASCNSTQTSVDTQSKLGADGLTLYRSLVEPHFSALRPILSYVRGTLDLGFQLDATFTSYLVAYLDVDWTGCQTTRCSTSGCCVILGDYLLSWSSMRQHTLSRPSTEVLLMLWQKLHGFGQVRVLRVPSHYQYVDIFTKGLSSALFEDFHTSLHPLPLKLLGCVMRIVCLWALSFVD
ncbi:ribonuclease H-like domain-containing protein [Tanacetum coccineum]